MILISEKDKKLLLYFGTLLLIGLILYKPFPYFISKIKSQRIELKGFEELLEKSKNIAFFQGIEQSYKENRENFKKLNFLFFEKPGILQYATLIEIAASQGGMKVGNFSFGAHEKSEISEMGQFFLTVELKGDYFGFKKFLEQQERTLPLLNPQKLTILPPGERGGVFSFNLWLLTYTKEPPKQKPEVRPEEEEM